MNEEKRQNLTEAGEALQNALDLMRPLMAMDFYVPSDRIQEPIVDAFTALGNALWAVQAELGHLVKKRP